MIDLIAKLLKALNSDSSPWQISVALAMGCVVGLGPIWTPQAFLIILFAFIFRVHFASFLLSVTFFSGFVVVFNSSAISIGEAMLGNNALVSFWTFLYQSEVWRMTQFNQTKTLGMFILSAILFLPIVFVARFLVIKYRQRVLAWVRRFKVMKFLKASKLYQAYHKLS